MKEIIKATGKKRLPANPPSYGHIYKRMNKYRQHQKKTIQMMMMMMMMMMGISY
jgi:hypothetical protein